MSKFILCTIPSLVAAVRASEKPSIPVNGVDFEEHAEGAISVEAVEDDMVVWRFSRIPGYELRDSKGDAEPKPKRGEPKKGASKDPAPTPAPAPAPTPTPTPNEDPAAGGGVAPPPSTAGAGETPPEAAPADGSEPEVTDPEPPTDAPADGSETTAS